MGTIDPESQALWNELRRVGAAPCGRPVQENPCCRLVRVSIMSVGFPAILSWGKDLKGRPVEVKINYCPQCGRKLR
ncbi:MAG: hypothetical protein M0Z71_12565 [Nitrospiraceae bacterium]|nr:hypothetical protein [Nitrospiraceae bacterium]